MPTPVSDDDDHLEDDQNPGEDGVNEMLSDDHIEVQPLFQDCDNLIDDKADAPERDSLARNICALLLVYTQIEEEIFYPAARSSALRPARTRLADLDLEYEARVRPALHDPSRCAMS